MLQKNMPENFQNLICVSIDGLHNGMIGAYGNSWIQTPAFDSLAVQSVVFDRYYAGSIDLAGNFNLLWKDLWVEQFSLNGGATILVTDDGDIFNHAGAYFVRKYMIEPSGKIATSADDTNFFKIFATIIDLASEQFVNQPDRPYCIWAHFCGFRGVWDFPLEYRERHRGDEDPAPYSGFVAPELDEFDPDKLQAVIESYSGGISLLDDVLAGLLEAIESGDVGEQTVLAIFGVRGFSLGEHKKIGANYDLFGENIHLPLIIRLPDKTGATVRSPELVNTDDLAEFFISMTKKQNDKSMLMRLMLEDKIEQHKTLKIIGQNNEIALVTPSWFIKQSEKQINVYVKPDDRWEINNVANRIKENTEIIAILKESRLL
jgi:membrane-anchored protein YejM (alkaline phosphatase superfamily)